MATKNRTRRQARTSAPDTIPMDHTEQRPAHVDFRRDIELVVKDHVTGAILCRTGVLVSPIEAHDIADEEEYPTYFEFGFEPAEGCDPPAGCEWHGYGWCDQGPKPRDEDKTLYRICYRKDSTAKWQDMSVTGRWSEAVEWAEKVKRKMKDVEVMIEPVEPSKVKGGAA